MTKAHELLLHFEVQDQVKALLLVKATSRSFLVASDHEATPEVVSFLLSTRSL